ncbi:MAG TPA: DUF3109 family protein [Saprospiraceae bacterium]|nr:DUF3109 family protein [Saprospiraceae bacterium]
MLIIQDKLVNDDIVEEYFACDLNACKGACCWEGDYGAPLEKEEIDILEEIMPDVLPYLDEESNNIIKNEGVSTYFSDIKTVGTPLKQTGDCVYLVRENGIAFCGIEKAYYDGKINFIKPVSCHLYPVRIEKDKFTGFETLSYNRWKICNPACANGIKKAMPLYRFVKNGLIRKYGTAFYEELEAAAEHLQEG